MAVAEAATYDPTLQPSLKTKQTRVAQAEYEAQAEAEAEAAYAASQLAQKKRG